VSVSVSLVGLAAVSTMAARGTAAEPKRAAATAVAAEPKRAAAGLAAEPKRAATAGLAAEPKRAATAGLAAEPKRAAAPVTGVEAVVMPVARSLWVARLPKAVARSAVAVARG
jgi:hypothetical protein